MTKNDNVVTKSAFYRTNPNLIPNSSIKILNFLLQEFFLGLPPLTDENFNSINPYHPNPEKIDDFDIAGSLGHK